ncbi:terpenoid synthase [Flammula alnicola]|nr:terpenoid synthase [Flammula alnicola]
MQEKSPKMIYIPETMAQWPWRRAINPHYEEVKAASNAWFEGFKAFTPQSQHAFSKGDFALVAALGYPSVSKEHLRIGCDLMNLFFVIDEYTDVEPAHVVRIMADIIIDALDDPQKPRPEDEHVLGIVSQQFWQLAIKIATPTAQRHMIESFTAYLDSVVQEAADRDSDTLRSIDTYFPNRRENVGARPAFVINELDLDLPDEVFYHPVIQEICYCIAELIAIDNDITSYNKEQATGNDRHNVVTIAMHEFNVDLDDAIKWAVSYHAEVVTKFLDGLKRVPSWGPEIDPQIKQYIRGLENWPRANDCWNFESQRYFGSKGLEIQKTRLVPLLPKSTSSRDSFLREGNVVVALVDDLGKL